VDDVELVQPLPNRRRITAEIASLVINRGVRRAAQRLARRIHPGFVHQRHRGFLSAGFDIGESLGVPVVLEWNSSEQWTRTHWVNARTGGRVFDRFLPAHERRAVQRANVIAAVSPLAAEMALEVGADPTRVIVVPNGVDIAAVDAAKRSVNGAPVADRLIGWVGTFGPWHGADLLVQALAQLPSDVRLLMVGDGAGRQSCETMAQELGVHDRVEWTGRLEHHAALRRLATCAVLATPQRDSGDRPFFGSPTKLFEYMALGRPIVATKVGVIDELIDDGRTGVLVPQEDPQALAAALRHILDDSERGSALAAAAREEAVSRHTWRHRAGLILDRAL
jgi:glycosyltransferase involved in cell wall biosynthesis